MHTYIDVHTFYLHTERMSSSNAIVHNTLNFVPLKLVYLKEKNLLILMRRHTMSLVMHTCRAQSALAPWDASPGQFWSAS